MKDLVRRIGAGVLVVAAVGAWFGLAPSSDHIPDRGNLISQAVADDVSNNLLTEGAPQQQVVNGWTARDLLIVIAKQQDDQAQQVADLRDQRPAALLLVLVVAAALGLTTQERVHA